MELYSVLLLISLLATGVSLVATVSRSRHRGATFAAAVLGFVAAVGSFAVHVSFGHAPGTAGALGPAAFIGEHPTLVAVLIVASVLFIVQSRRRRHHE